ncbi:unnamed protein product [Rotaria sp. Silwood2]|nr:unnamed protein product [Rotaria sp. Silwood2]
MLTKSHLTYDKCQRIICFLRHVSNDSIKKHDDLNYFKQSILPTDHFQSSLPHLSIPKLDLTCQRYLTAVRPILNNDENSYEQTRQIVENFRRGDGKRLDAQLRQKIKMNKHTSYLSKPWFEMYLKSRLPLVLNFNVFFLFTDDQQQLKPAARITNYIVSSIRFMNSLRANWLDSGLYYLNSKRIKTDQFGKYFRYLPKLVSYYAAVLQKFYPLDMSQFNHLFNSTRIPKVNCDLLVTYTENIRHIIVIKRGHYYKVNILEQNGQLLPIEKIASIMKYLYEDLNEEENKYSLGYFTADKRERWALIRQQIEALSECNKQALKEIDSSIMIVCLGEFLIFLSKKSIQNCSLIEILLAIEQFLCI